MTLAGACRLSLQLAPKRHLHLFFEPATEVKTMPTLPPTDASDEEWRAFAEERCEELKPHVAEFILERFTYKPRYVQQRVWRTFATVSALSLQFESTSVYL